MLTPEALLAQSLAAGQHVAFKEINAEIIQAANPHEKAEIEAIRTAMGSEHALQLRAATAGKQEPSKMQKRRHQINSLYHQAKLTELHDMERKLKGTKSKSETAAKYGW
jgi:proline-rich protein PRCC